MTDYIEDRARAALEGVTPGPWEAGPSPVGYYDEPSIHTADGLGVALVDEGECQDANARFIAAARSLVPEMADEIERLRAEVATLQDRLGITRMCVACGAMKPADQPRHDPAPGCDGAACTWDLTPREAADHWRQEAHTLRANLAEAKAEIELLRGALNDTARIAYEAWHDPRCEASARFIPELLHARAAACVGAADAVDGKGVKDEW